MFAAPMSMSPFQMPAMMPAAAGFGSNVAFQQPNALGGNPFSAGDSVPACCSGNLLQSIQAMEGLLLMMMQMLMGGQGAQGGQSSFGAPGSFPGQSGIGGSPSAVGGPSNAGGSAPTSSGSGSSAGAAPVEAAQSSAPASNGGGASPVQFGPGTKVLEIGDSHTVGTFGDELDKKLRSTGSQVATYASAGASPDWFVKGTPTKYGYSERHADGSKSTTPYGQSHATPKLDQLIGKEKPNVIVVNLGANFRGAGAAGIKQQVSSIGEVAKKHGIPIVWVGPPKSSKDNGNPGSLNQFDQQMAAAVAPYGTYISSAPFVPKYSGSDGLHFNGAEGTQIARNWADGVFKKITGR